MEILEELWNDEAGFIISVELILIATILVIGIVVGLVAIRDSLTGELSDIGASINDLNQSYTLYGITGPSAAVSGSDFSDNTDSSGPQGDQPGVMANCIVVSPSVGNENGVAPTPNG
ncbi:hypothetical protein [Blastopirellula marina]|uniref:Branched-chain amino acid aminotransferase n=1 Tax=Blastopirellula marina TaxID=124 RepID=A0A2S8GJY9_9BACT|nr:hypothetical protein [Blastopirellula marina]PQO44631.1 hypothetical protein C5Y93_17830 [Blastopirellula marina]